MVFSLVSDGEFQLEQQVLEFLSQKSGKWQLFYRVVFESMLKRRICDLTSPFRAIIARLTNVLIRRNRIKLIFIFGMSRSGTTFLSKTLSLGADANYLHEPVKALMRGKYKALFKADAPPFWDYVFFETNIPLKVHYLVMVVLFELLFGRTKKGDTLCIKPISMFDSVLQVSQVFPSASIVYITRSPYGYIDSLIRQSLKDPEHKGRDFSDGVLESAARDWKVQNDKMLQLFAANQDWHWVDFEAMCTGPVEYFRNLFRELGLKWDEGIEQTIYTKTSTSSTDYYGENRNSHAQIDKWK